MGKTRAAPLVWVALQTEVRLLCGHRGYGLLHLLWAGFITATVWGRDVGSAQAWLHSFLSDAGLPVLCLAALLLAGLSATRAQRSGFAAIEAALPGGGALLAGRALASLLVVLPLLVAPLLVAAAVGPWPSFIRGLPHFLVAALPSILATVILAWATAELLPLGPRSFLGGLVLLWLGLLVAPLTRVIVGISFPPGALLDMTRYVGAPYSELWAARGAGALLDTTRAAARPALRLIWLIGLGIGLLALALAARRWHRDRHLPLTPILTCAAALSLGGLAGAQYLGEVTALQERFLADAGYPSQPPELPEGRVDHYNLSVDLRDLERPHFVAVMTLRNAGEAPLSRFELTLHRELAVVEANLPYERSGSRMSLRLSPPLAPGATREARISYAGAIRRGTAMPGSPPEVVYFTGPEGAWLSTEAGWYPIAGKALIQSSILAGQFLDLYATPFSARVAVLAPPGFGVATNLPPVAPGIFVGQDTRWLMLVASPELVHELAGQVQIVAPRHDLPALRAPAAEYQRVLAVAQSFFPDVRVDGLTLLGLGGSPTLPYETPPGRGRLIIAHGRDSLTIATAMPPGSEVRRITYGRPVVEDLWRLGGGDTSALAFDAADLFIWSVIAAEGDASQVGAVGDPSLAAAPLVAVLGEVYRASGEATVAEVLRLMRSDSFAVETEAQLRALVEEVIDE